jgi:hypothetical protein
VVSNAKMPMGFVLAVDQVGHDGLEVGRLVAAGFDRGRPARFTHYSEPHIAEPGSKPGAGDSLPPAS